MVIGTDCDVLLLFELADRLSTYIDELQLIENLRIPREKCLNNVLDTQLHYFSDVSELGHATCVYICTEDVRFSKLIE